MENLLLYSQGAEHFEEALPIGNGTIGAMVYGKCKKEKVSLNHDTLWSGKPRRITRPNAVEAFNESRLLAECDKLDEANKLLANEFTAPWSQTYLPLGNLYFSCLNEGLIENYSRRLDIQNGIASVSYTQNGISFDREYFISYPDKSLVINITSDKAVSYIFEAESQLTSNVTTCENKIYLTGECPTSIAPKYVKDTIRTEYDGDGIKFAAIGNIETDGTIESKTSSLIVTNATNIIFTMCIETSFLSFDALPTKPYVEPCEAQIKKVASKSYNEIKEAHIEDFSKYYTRVKADFGFAPSNKMTDERLSNPDKSTDLGIVELLYNFGRYLIISASRSGSQATNLQGIWNEDMFPAWSSNYTVNINTEMNYWPVLMNNLAGFDQPIIDLVRKISVTGVAAAKNFYGAKGFCAHHNIDLWGHATPVGAQLSFSVIFAFWNMSSGWLCRHLWEHYEYTLDLDFLRNTAYPLMKGAAEFYLDIMVKSGDKYIISPTTSPENAYYHKKFGEIALAKSAAMTQAILIDLFTNISKSAEILGINDEFVDNVREKLPYLNTYKIGSHGQLLEYNEDFEESDIHHRHVSHLYGLYPGESITTSSTPQLANACRVSLERRGDISTGWAMGWRVCLWAKLKDGDHALKLIKNQLKYVDPLNNDENYSAGGTYPNLLDAHPPFQIDGNFGVCAGITLMLLQCENDKIHILPALPSEFKNGSVYGLKAKGNITVDIIWENGNLKSYSLESPVDCKINVVTPLGETVAVLKANVKSTF